MAEIDILEGVHLSVQNQVSFFGKLRTMRLIVALTNRFHCILPLVVV